MKANCKVIRSVTSIFGCATILGVILAVPLIIGVEVQKHKQDGVTPEVAQERIGVLLRECFPAPAYTYMNGSPLCASFKQFIIDTADEAEEEAVFKLNK